MALATLKTRALAGMDSPQVTVEVHVSNGLPSFSIVGLPEASVKESKERVRSAIISAGFQMPAKRITVNLAPADLPKAGGRYDLAIAVGVLIASEQVALENDLEFECYGELALTSELRPVQGLIASLLAAQQSDAKILLPAQNVDDALLVMQTYPQLQGRLFAVNDLSQACLAILGQLPALTSTSIDIDRSLDDFQDIADVQGQLHAKRALEVAASGHHSMLMIGPPGAGKTMLASRLVSIMPELSAEESIEVATIRSLAGQAVTRANIYQRPFIHPHHTASAASLVGGGTHPKPGALSLAHGGVLFLDELPEFKRDVLEALREPLESKRVNISRVNQHVSYPADSLLITAMNPSPSGFFPDDHLGRCKDTPDQIARYQKKISGPLLDRIDLHLQVPAVEVGELQHTTDAVAESSEQVRQRVIEARAIQQQRQGCFNSQLESQAMQKFAKLDSSGNELLDKAAKELGFSARGYHRILRVARTLADMQNSQNIEVPHLAEALSYRSQVNL